MTLELNFKLLLEMPHLAPRKHGLPIPFVYEGKYVKYIDLKFETYPAGSPERKLSLWTSKFYGKLPGQHRFFIMDDVKNCYVSNTPPEDGTHTRLRDDWVDYAVFMFMDGSIKEPREITEEDPNIVSKPI